MSPWGLAFLSICAILEREYNPSRFAARGVRALKSHGSLLSVNYLGVSKQSILSQGPAYPLIMTQEMSADARRHLTFLLQSIMIDDQSIIDCTRK